MNAESESVRLCGRILTIDHIIKKFGSNSDWSNVRFRSDCSEKGIHLRCFETTAHIFNTAFTKH